MLKNILKASRQVKNGQLLGRLHCHDLANGYYALCQNVPWCVLTPGIVPSCQFRGD